MAANVEYDMGKVKVACCVMTPLSGDGDGLGDDELGGGLPLVTGGGAVLEAEGGGDDDDVGGGLEAVGGGDDDGVVEVPVQMEVRSNVE